MSQKFITSRIQNIFDKTKNDWTDNITEINTHKYAPLNAPL